MLIRHGTRRPKVKKINEMRELAEVNVNSKKNTHSKCIFIDELVYVFCSFVMKLLKIIKMCNTFPSVEVTGISLGNGNGMRILPMTRRKC